MQRNAIALRAMYAIQMMSEFQRSETRANPNNLF